MAGKSSFGGGGKQGLGGRMPPQTNLQPLARIAQMARQRQANPTAQQFAPQTPVAPWGIPQPNFEELRGRGVVPEPNRGIMPVNPNMPVQKGPQFRVPPSGGVRVPPSGGKGGFGGGPMPQQQMMARQVAAQRQAMPQQPSPQNSGRNMALAQALSRFRR